jgi:DNA topoisomerase-6 subunit B
MYAQLTTGKPLAHHQSRAVKSSPARCSSHRYRKNRPNCTEGAPEMGPAQGTRVEGWSHYQRGRTPSTCSWADRDRESARAHWVHRPAWRAGALRAQFSELPPRPQEIKPHPHGVELGRLIQMLGSTEATRCGGF